MLDCPKCGCLVYTNSFLNIAKCSSCKWEAKLSEYRDEWRRRFLENIKEKAKDSHRECEHATV